MPKKGPNQPENEALSKEQKIELLRQYPPKLRGQGVGGPVKSLSSGEILIRSHDPNPEIGDLDEGDTTLPRGILNTGDPEILQIYKELYADTLRAMPDGALYVEYLDQRIERLTRIKGQMKESLDRTKEGELPQLPPVKEYQDETIRLTNVEQTQFQSSSQGCWSVALSNILKSRGIEISQEDIRAFRPTISFQSANELRAYETNEMNNDAGSDPYHDSELVMNNIPNTAVRHWGFEDLPPALIDENGNVYRDITDDAAVAAIKKQVEYAIWHDQSPVALKYCGHYQTVIGIKGNKLLLKDSLPPAAYDDLGNPVPRDPNTTYEIDLYDIVRKTRSLQEGYNRDLSLMWVSELHKDPITGKIEELKDFPDLKVEEDGKLTLAQAENPNILTVEGPADTECGITSNNEVNGLIPYFKTKFPNVIHKDILKNVSEPSRSIAENLTIHQVAPSDEVANGTIVAKLPGYSDEIDLDLPELTSSSRVSQTSGNAEFFDLLREEQKVYLQNPARFDELATIFDTKKHIRFVNRNSDEYDAARNAIDKHRVECEEFRQFVTDNYGQKGFDEKAKEKIARLNESENNLRTALSAYVTKVTRGGRSVSDITQAAGAARLTGARGLLDMIGLGENAPQIQNLDVDNSADKGRNGSEQVRTTTFETLYTEKYKQLKENRASNAHRQAASYAQEELKKQLKSAQKTSPSK